MSFLERLQNFIDSTEEKTFRIYLFSIVGAVLALSIGLIVWHYLALSTVSERIEMINESRQQARKIITTNKQLELEQKNLDRMLDKDPFFSLVEYVSNLLAQYHLQPAKQVEPTSSNRLNQYNERTVRVEIRETDMKTLTELIEELTQNERVTIKEVEITAAKGQSIDVSLTLATLYKKTQSS